MSGGGRANPDAADFVRVIRVYYEDTDAGGVVYHASYLRFLERARTEWLRALGFDQQVLMRDPGVLFAVRRIEIDYLLPARLDDRLEVTCRVERLRGTRIDFAQRIVRAEGGDVLCRARVQVACLDASDLRPARIPAALARRMDESASNER